MRSRPLCKVAGPRRQRAAVSLLAILFLLTVIAAVLATALTMSSSDIIDSAEQNDSVKALLLAESGIERQIGRLAGTACASLVPDSFSLGGGTVTLLSAALAGGECQVRVSATVGRATRTVDGWLRGGGGAIALDTTSDTTGNGASLTWSHTVAGSDRALIVGVSIRNNAGQTVSGVTFGGTALTPIGAQNGGANNVRVELWYLVAPAAATANVVVTLSASARMVGGAISLTGVDQANPVDASGFNNGSSNTPGVSVTTVSNNAWVVDTLAHRLNATSTAGAGQTEAWNAATGGGPVNGVGGSGSHEGPKSPAGAVPMTWSLSDSQVWAIGAVALRPGGSPTLVRWAEVTL